MPKINWVRVIVGGLVVAAICFFSDGLLHEKVLGTDWKAVYDNLGVAPPEPHRMGLAYFAIFELGRGLLSMFLYAMMRPYCGPGPKTAAYAGVGDMAGFLDNWTGSIYSLRVLLECSLGKGGRLSTDYIDRGGHRRRCSLQGSNHSGRIAGAIM